MGARQTRNGYFLCTMWEVLQPQNKEITRCGFPESTVVSFILSLQSCEFLSDTFCKWDTSQKSRERVFMFEIVGVAI